MNKPRLSKVETRILEQYWKLGTASVREFLERGRTNSPIWSWFRETHSRHHAIGNVWFVMKDGKIMRNELGNR